VVQVHTRYFSLGKICILQVEWCDINIHTLLIRLHPPYATVSEQGRVVLEDNVAGFIFVAVNKYNLNVIDAYNACFIILIGKEITSDSDIKM
jgi:hypothetical protein